MGYQIKCLTFVQISQIKTIQKIIEDLFNKSLNKKEQAQSNYGKFMYIKLKKQSCKINTVISLTVLAKTAPNGLLMAYTLSEIIGSLGAGSHAVKLRTVSFDS